MLRAHVRQLVDGTGRSGRRFDLIFQALIVASMVAFIIETEPDLSSDVRTTLRVFEAVTVVAFSLEYALRLWAAQRPLRFVFSFWGVVDLVAILPFFLGTAVDLRSIRILRLLRLVRLLKLARYTSAVERFRRAFKSMRAELTLFLVTSGILIYIVSVGIYYCERDAQPEVFGSIGACIWWSIVTLTTVGYGDAYPITVGGRVFTTVVLVIGLGVVAIPSGMVASALTNAAQPSDESD